MGVQLVSTLFGTLFFLPAFTLNLSVSAVAVLCVGLAALAPVAYARLDSAPNSPARPFLVEPPAAAAAAAGVGGGGDGRGRGRGVR
jgi:hypothetical protein